MKLFLLIAVAALLQQGHTNKYFDYHQSVALFGQLYCNGSPVAGAKVELRDTGIKGKAGELAQSKTNQNGRFFLFGSKPLTFPVMKPGLWIHFTCHGKES
ncbi:Transthyretin-like family protein, partial [Cooperia oncophora]